MHKKYIKYIKSKLKEIIPNEFPCFVFLDDQKSYGLDYNFVCKDGNDLKMISIQNAHDENSFIVELFWSNDGSKFQNDLTHFWIEEGENILEKICSESGSKLRVRLPVFYANDFASWWAIDPTGNILKSIKDNGFITSDAYFQFYSEDTFLSDENDLSEELFKEYIDPLIYNVVELLKEYAIPLFDCLNNKTLWEIYFDEPYSTLVLGNFKAYKIPIKNIKEIRYSKSRNEDIFYVKLSFRKNIEKEDSYGFIDVESYRYLENELLVSKDIDTAIEIANNNNIPILHQN